MCDSTDYNRDDWEVVHPPKGWSLEPHRLDTMISVRLPFGLAAAARDKANWNGVSLSDWIRDTLAEAAYQPSIRICAAER